MERLEIAERIQECAYKAQGARNGNEKKFYLDMKAEYEKMLDLNSQKVFIKGHFGKWKETTLEKARKYFQDRINHGCSFTYLTGIGFSLHFKGVTVNEILDGIN